jgi:multiple sugar transport system ATP-binding protein
VTQVLGLQPYLDRKPTELSGGQQQRVAIARAMIKTPKVFLFDEPLSNLDAQLRATMRDEIARLHRKLRTTTVYVTHDQMEAMTLADRIVLMKDGKIEQVGTPEEIYEKPRTFFVAGFIGTPAMNFLELVVECGALVGDGVRLELGLSGFDIRDGQKVILGVRPANLHLAAADGPQVLTGVTDLTEYHGDQVLISYDVGPNRIHASVPARDRPDEGETVRFSLDENEIHLFDRETGLSLLSA